MTFESTRVRFCGLFRAKRTAEIILPAEGSKKCLRSGSCGKKLRRGKAVAVLARAAEYDEPRIGV